MKINDIYNTVPQRTVYEPQPVLTEDEIRARMSDITRRANDERQRLRDAYGNLGSREATAKMAITFAEPKFLLRPEAKQYLEAAIAAGTKLTDTVKKWLIEYELETEQIAYDLAKFDCDTSDKDFSKLEPQMSFYQTLLKMQ